MIVTRPCSTPFTLAHLLPPSQLSQQGNHPGVCHAAQVLGGLGVVFAIEFPPFYDEVFKWFSLLELNFLELVPLTCSVDGLSGFNLALVLRTAVPCVLLLGMFLLHVVATRRGTLRARQVSLAPLLKRYARLIDTTRA